MTTLREAAQMALDALEQVQEADTAGATPKMVMEARKLYEPTITALRAALAQPEQEPEPYCYTWDVWISGGYWEARYGWEPYCGGKRPAHSTEAKPLYTAPPQREWQGLTDEELRSMCKQTWVFDTIKQWAKIIEAKLREKNT